MMPDRDCIVTFDGRDVHARAGQSVASALLAADIVALRETRVGARPRGIFCGMGICFDCLVVVDGMPNVRACVEPVREGMRVERQRGTG
jgi:predicted molibdopterin-dependent oxidoreductase YjgC